MIVRLLRMRDAKREMILLRESSKSRCNNRNDGSQLNEKQLVYIYHIHCEIKIKKKYFYSIVLLYLRGWQENEVISIEYKNELSHVESDIIDRYVCLFAFFRVIIAEDMHEPM